MAPAALVTGGARRVGRAVGLALADAGYDVAVHYGGSADAARETVSRIEAKGRRAVAVQGDLADEAALADIVDQAAAQLGPLALLVNNASVFDDDRLGDLPRRVWDRHFDVNLRAPLLLAERFTAQVPASTPDGEACIVNMLDQRVLKPNPQFFSYALSKSALWTATRMAAQALAPRVRVNGVGPGPTLASTHQEEDAFAREAAATPLQRPVAPEQIAAAVVYLASARAVTGQMLAVDSGQHLAWRTPDIAGD